MLRRGRILDPTILAILHDRTKVFRTASRRHIIVLSLLRRQLFRVTLFQACLSPFLRLEGLLNDRKGWVLCHGERLVVVIRV